MKKQLKEICNGFTKNISQKELDELNGDYEIYGASGLIKKINYYISEVPYIGVVKDGSGVGRVNSYPAKSSLIGTMQYIVPNNGIDLQYLMYALRSMNLGKLFKGAAIPHIYFKEYKEFNVNVPTLPEQQKIARHLDTIQSAIDNKKQQLKQLDELVKSKFVEMFGDPITNSKNFPTRTVIEVVTLQRGYDLPIQDRDANGTIPVYGSNGRLGTHSVAKIEKGIVTGRSGTIGEVHLCNEPFWPLNTTLFSNNTHGNNLIYLKFLLEFFDLKRFKSGVGVPTLNRNEFHNEEIIDVSLDLQNAFAAFVQKIDTAKSLVKNQLADLSELLDSKMDEYFGE